MSQPPQIAERSPRKSVLVQIKLRNLEIVGNKTEMSKMFGNSQPSLKRLTKWYLIHQDTTNIEKATTKPKRKLVDSEKNIRNV